MTPALLNMAVNIPANPGPLWTGLPNICGCGGGLTMLHAPLPPQTGFGGADAAATLAPAPLAASVSAAITGAVRLLIWYSFRSPAPSLARGDTPTKPQWFLNGEAVASPAVPDRGSLATDSLGARDREQALYGMCDVLVYSHEEEALEPDPRLHHIDCDRCTA